MLAIYTPVAYFHELQIYADWWYAWCFTYFMSPHDVHRYVYITLKKSLRWVPIVGWVSAHILADLLSFSCQILTGHAILQIHLSRSFMGF